MKRAEVKRGLLSLGIAFLISAPISMMALQSWNNPTTDTQKGLPEDFRWTQGVVENKAHEIFAEELKRQALEQAEIERQNELDSYLVAIDEQHERIILEAEQTLEEYGVEVPADIQIFCEQAQEESNVCAELLEAIAWRESRYIPYAENSGCSGLMQVSVRWHKDRMERLGVKDIYDAQGNIRVAADYLHELFGIYDGDLYKVLMAYNGDTSKGVSNYAKEIAEISEALERVHGK